MGQSGAAGSRTPVFRRCDTTRVSKSPRPRCRGDSRIQLPRGRRQEAHPRVIHHQNH